MARRRKGGGRRKPAASRPRKGSSGAEQEQPPPPPTSTATPTPVESEESCLSPGKQQDTSSSNASLPAEPAEREPTQQQARQMPHKKFGKFRYLIDKDFHPDSVADTSSAASTGEERSAQPTPTPMEDSPIPGPGPLDTPEPEDAQPQVAAAIVTQTEQVILESEPVWGEEIIEGTVVCEAIGNLDIDPSTDNSQSVESKDSDSQDLQLKVESIEIMKSSESKDSIISIEEKEEKPVLESETITQFAEMNLIKELVDGNGGSADSSDVNESSDGSNKIRRSSRIRSIGNMRKTREVRDPIRSQVVAVPAPPQLEEDKDSMGGSENLSLISSAPESDVSKPVKVKSRWRRSSELELGGGNKESDSENNATSRSATSSPTPLANADLAQVVDENDERLRQFVIIQENEYHTERQTSKEAKRMLCDCFLTREEIQRGELGCGEDCLNRLLMIECGSRCSVGDLCSNKHFQKHENARCQVVKTEKKGYGLQVMEDLPPGAFIMEYVGEVIDPREFRRRAKDYARDKNRHYYFMALKSDTIIDATARGSISRFINHSCDPNSETQKWTVNGELRIGFFTKTAVRGGDEITFDYQLQRYGKEAQRCFCEAVNCRGWIGEDPGKDKAAVPLSAVATTTSNSTSVKKSSSSSKKKESTKTKDFLDDMDLEEEITKLCISGLKNRAHTLTLCRLMVRASDSTSRLRILQLLREGDTACRRLFLDYHGLRLLWSWMVDDSEAELRANLLEALAALPIPNKTMLQDSKVLKVVEKWAMPIPEGRPAPSVPEDSNGENSVASTTSSDPTPTVASAAALLAEWSSLKETFRIPKRERIEQMKEHEREADRGYNEYLDTKQSYSNSWRQARRMDSLDTATQGKKSSKPPLTPRDPNQPRLSKHERRHQFALKVAQQEEQERQRRHQEELWRKHEAHCLALGMNPTHWISYDPNTGLACYLNQSTCQWLPFTPPEGGLPVYPEMTPVPAQPVETFAPPLPRIRLPPHWRSARDNLGQVFYYHIMKRVPQWEPPVWQLPPTAAATEEGEGDSTEEEEEEEESGEEEEEEDSESNGEESDTGQTEGTSTTVSISSGPEEEDEPSPETVPVSALSSGNENEETIEENLEAKETSNSPKTENPESELVEITKPEVRKRREGLVQERIISPRREEDRIDPKHYRAVKAQLRKKKEIAKQREKKRRKEKSLNSSSDGSKSDSQKSEVSSEVARKIKDQFRQQMANNIVTHLNPFRKQDCKVGRITNTDDFKQLARKLTHFVMLKELKHCRSVEELVCNENVKHKARDFIKKYMAKFGAVYQRTTDDD